MKAIGGDRWSAVVAMLGATPASVVDIGCRGRELAAHLPSQTRYVGFDLFPPADVIGTAEEPLPFGDGTFETAVCADVLEHLENPHAALDEAMRVASGSVVVFLPNLYTMWLRLQYLRGVPADKYEFGPDPTLDRHRWIMNVDQAAAFTRGRAQRAGWRVADERGWERAFSRRGARIAYGVARRVTSPNLWAWSYAARLEPARSPSSP